MEFDISNIKLFIGIPVNRDFPWQTAQSLLNTSIYLTKNNIPFEVQFVVGSSIIELARTKVTHAFLKSDMTKLLMIDSDQSWTVDDIIRLIALSSKMAIVCGSYPAKREPLSYLMDINNNEMETNEYGCLPVNGLGLGFVIVDRAVINEMAINSDNVLFPDETEPMKKIFQCYTNERDEFVGEDIAFFQFAKELGYQCWLDPKINIGHIGSKEYKGNILNNIIVQP